MIQIIITLFALRILLLHYNSLFNFKALDKIKNLYSSLLESYIDLLGKLSSRIRNFVDISGTAYPQISKVLQCHNTHCIL